MHTAKKRTVANISAVDGHVHNVVPGFALGSRELSVEHLSKLKRPAFVPRDPVRLGD